MVVEIRSSIRSLNKVMLKVIFNFQETINYYYYKTILRKTSM